MLDDVRHWLHLAAAPGMVLTDQILQVLRVMVIGVAAWVGVEIISLSRQVAILQTQVTAMTTEISGMHAVLEARDTDNLRRSEHDRYSALLEERLRTIERRLDNQSRVLTDIATVKKHGIVE